MIGLWRRWVAFWDEREDPLPLALARLLVGLCWVYDFAYMGLNGLVVPLFAVAEVGGLSDALMREHTPWIYALFPGTLAGAYAIYALLLCCSVGVTLGAFTRSSALVLLVIWSGYADVVSYADRGIDNLSRLVLLVLVLSPAGRAWSVDAWWSTGSFFGDGRPWPAFARRLLIFQLVLMYFVAGVSKTDRSWWPAGDHLALYYALQDPSVAGWDFSFVRRQPFLVLTQLGTAGTLVYQISYPLVLLIFWWRRHPGSGGAIGRFAVRWRLEWLWIAAGGVFHLLLALSMVLGIFPWAMLALYPLWFAPGELRGLWRALHARLWDPPAAP